MKINRVILVEALLNVIESWHECHILSLLAFSHNFRALFDKRHNWGHLHKFSEFCGEGGEITNHAH